MSQNQHAFFARNDNYLSEETLNYLYKYLLPVVTRWVYFCNLPSWSGQEYDVIQDIIQETITRLVKYAEQSHVYAPERMCLVIAKHYYLDLKRKDYRIEHIIADVIAVDQGEFSEMACNNVILEELFTLLASEISKFPKCQRTALLTDLASRMHFGPELTLLQKSFLQIGINLQAYRLPIPLDLKARQKRASLLNHAYRRLLKLESVQRYIADL